MRNEVRFAGKGNAGCSGLRMPGRCRTFMRLRGADALYVTVAMQYGARLVTLDAEQLERAPASVSACKPSTAIASLKIGE